MEEKIEKEITDFFSFFEEFYATIDTCMKDCHKCAVSLHKFIYRCKNIRDAEVTGTPLEEFEGLQNKLCAALHNLIEKEIQELRHNLSIIEDLFDKLCIKLKVFHQGCEELDFTEQTSLIKGSPLQPPLEQLLEFAYSAAKFGSEICAKIETSLTVISFRCLNNDSLVDNFRISNDWNRRMREILAYTSFFSENQE